MRTGKLNNYKKKTKLKSEASDSEMYHHGTNFYSTRSFSREKT